MKNINDLCKEFKENKRLQEELNELNEQIKAQIIELMAGAEEVTAGAFKAIYKNVNTSRIDTAELKKAAPELCEKFTKNTIYKRFNVI